jgi:hypothetical protein
MVMDFMIWHASSSSGVVSTILLEDMDEAEAISKARETVSSKAQQIAKKESKPSIIGLFEPSGDLVCAWTVTKSGKVRRESTEITRDQFDTSRIKTDFEATRAQVRERKRQKSVKK